jgi:hypothetical protein
VPIAFRDAIDVEELGPAAFLKVETGAGGAEYLGALFLINARGEPLEFAYNRVELPETFLWRPTDLRRHAERELTASLLTVCTRTPRLLLCLADEVGSELFCRDLALEIPIGRLGQPLKATAYSGEEIQEVVEEPEPLHLFWFPAAPAAGSLGRELFERLCTHGLLLEPFERAATGLMEVYSGDVSAER